MNVINTNDPKYWENMRARVAAEKLEKATEAALSWFCEHHADLKVDRLPEIHVVNSIQLAHQAYDKLQNAIGTDVWDEDAARAFIARCADGVDMSEMNVELSAAVIYAAMAKEKDDQSRYGNICIEA